MSQAPVTTKGGPLDSEGEAILNLGPLLYIYGNQAGVGRPLCPTALVAEVVSCVAHKCPACTHRSHLLEWEKKTPSLSSTQPFPCLLHNLLLLAGLQKRRKRGDDYGGQFKGRGLDKITGWRPRLTQGKSRGPERPALLPNQIIITLQLAGNLLFFLQKENLQAVPLISPDKGFPPPSSFLFPPSPPFPALAQAFTTNLGLFESSPSQLADGFC